MSIQRSLKYFSFLFFLFFSFSFYLFFSFPFLLCGYTEHAYAWATTLSLFSANGLQYLYRCLLIVSGLKHTPCVTYNMYCTVCTITALGLCTSLSLQEPTHERQVLSSSAVQAVILNIFKSFSIELTVTFEVYIRNVVLCTHRPGFV